MVTQVLLISSLTFLLFCMPHTLNPGVFIVLAAKSGPCADNPCWSRGECHLVWINSTYATHKCNCSSGFVGVNCEHGSTLIDINIIIDFNILSIYFKHFKYVLLAVQCLTGLSHVQVIPWLIFSLPISTFRGVSRNALYKCTYLLTFFYLVVCCVNFDNQQTVSYSDVKVQTDADVYNLNETKRIFKVNFNRRSGLLATGECLTKSLTTRPLKDCTRK